MQPCVLLKYGEMVLRGRNRRRFYEQLQRNVRRQLAGIGPLELRQRGGALAVFAPRADPGEVVRRALEVLGVTLVHPAVSVERSVDAAIAAAIELLRERDGQTFAIRARRRDKRFPVESHELATLAGRAVQDALGLGVDLGSPDLELFLEVDRDEIFAFTEKLRGRGGLPVGTSGRALVLLSGGIDSPVAAYRMLKRGLRCDFVHFSGTPFTGPESIYKAYAHVARLDRFQGDSRLFVVSFGRAQRSLATVGAARLQVLAQRRLMVRVACGLARREGASALVTGDSLGQVASQTLQNLAVVEAASELPLLRPLLGWDKSEITREAEELGTLDVSVLPAQDCCTLFASPLAETRAQPARLDRIEGRLELDTLVAELVAAAELVEPRPETPVAA
jgi:thiamine biosynthesis protein ThiI